MNGSAAAGSSPSRPLRGPIRTVLVDDHVLVRDGLRLVLGAASDVEVVGEAGGGRELLEILAAVRADLILLDVTLPDDDGLQLLRAIRARYPELGVVVLTMHRDGETVRQAFAAGASGYVVKGASARDLLDAIRAVRAGQRYVHSSVAAAIVDDAVSWRRSDRGLSPREREILSLIAAGHTSSQVAALLGISIHTFRRHVANLSQKLDLRGLNALTRYAVEHGLAREARRPVRPEA